MSHSVTIGKKDDGHVLRLDVERLIASRLLVTAASGGGKSWLLRKILEEVSATTQTLVIDPEGEFASLREIRDMVLVGADGDLPADPRSAGLLCRRLMEQNVSAVMDIYELPPDRRRQFVAAFLTEMVNLPKPLWRRCFVAIDEAHEFAPNTKDKDYVSGEPVALLFSKGRKRGFCPIIATQRLAKLSMDVAAEAKNRFIGQTTLDVDQKRAADFLGWSKERWTELRDLSPPGHEGEFFGVGPAFNDRGVVKFRAGMVKSSHPKVGEGVIPEPPAPSKKIMGVLSELTDLPRQAEEEIRDLAAAKRKIAELETAAAVAKAPAPKVDPAELRTARTEASRMRKGLEQAMKLVSDINAKQFEVGVDPAEVEAVIGDAVKRIVGIVEKKINRRNTELLQMKADACALVDRLQKILVADGADVNPKVDAERTTGPTPRDIVIAHHRQYGTPATQHEAQNPEGRRQLSPTERAVLDAAASFPGGATKQRISIFSGRSIKSSSFEAVFAGGECKEGKRPSLVQAGLLVKKGEKKGEEKYSPSAVGQTMALPTRGTSLNDWLSKLKPSETKVLKCLADAYPERLMRGDVAQRTGQSALSSSFDAAFPALRELGLIEGSRDFAITADLAATREERS